MSPDFVRPVLVYGKNVFISLDQLVNAILGGLPDETISSRIGKSIRDGGWASHIPWPRWWIDHCLSSIEDDEV